MRGFDEALARGERFACIIDSDGMASIPPAHERKKIVAWMNEPAFQTRQKQFNVGSATIIRSAAARGCLTAITWVWTPPTPQYYPGTIREAAEWCIRKLEEADVPISLEARRYVEELQAQVASTGTG
jgi:hypothetical protein